MIKRAPRENSFKTNDISEGNWLEIKTYRWLKSRG